MTNQSALVGLEQLTAKQFGLFTDEQAFREGVTADMVLRHCRPGGRWRRVAPRVYELTAQPDDWRRPLLAAQLSLGVHAVLSHRSAQRILGMDGARDGPPELIVRGGNEHGPWIVHRRGRLAPEDVTATGPFVHTATRRTVLDLAAVLGHKGLELAVEWALRDGHVAEHELLGRARGRGVRGVRRLREVLERRPLGAPPTGSELETRFVQLVRAEPGIPDPVRQHAIVQRGRTVAVLDLAWPDHELFVELDGQAFHTGAAAAQYDASRQNAVVVALGWRPLRFTWDDVVRRPATTARLVRQAVSHAGVPAHARR